MKNHITKKSIAIISLALLILITVGTTLALVFTDTKPVQNTFTPSRVSCAVVETLVNGDNSTTTETSAGTVSNFTSKSDVKIKNTGDTDAYIRVAIVVNWMSESGNVYAMKPVQGNDYSMSLILTNGGWFEEGGYYYYSMPVAPGDFTPVLIKEAKILGTANKPQGDYDLSIEIVASAIQSAPGSVVKDNWKIEPNQSGMLNDPSTEASE